MSAQPATPSTKGRLLLPHARALAPPSLYECGDGYALPFTVIGVVALVAAALPALTRPPGTRATTIVDLRERKDAGTPSR